MFEKTLKRREMLQLAGLGLLGPALAACRARKREAAAGGPAGPVVTAQGRLLPPDAAPVAGQTLYEAAAEPRHLDIARDIYGAGVAINWGGEPLLRRDQNQNLVPALAEAWQAGPNAEYFDFRIRREARWSDGVPLTAHDWVFTFRHLASPTLDNPWAWFYYDIKGLREWKAGTGRAEEIGVEALDERTLRIRGADGPVPHLPALLAYQAAAPTPRHKAESNPEHWADTVEGFVSSGPMRLLVWEHSQRLEWDANPYYNGPHKPGVQRLVQLLGAPATGWYTAWLNREIDYIATLQPHEVAEIRSDPELSRYLHTYDNFQTEYLAFDTLRPPLNNPALRLALASAIDRDTLCNQVMLATRTPARTMLPPGFPAYNAELGAVQAFSPERARAQLAAAGYPAGKDASGQTLTLDLYANGREVLLEYVKDQWERHLGLQVNLQLLEGAVWAQRRAAHALQIFRGQYEYDFLDPANLLTHLWRSADEQGSPRHAWRNVRFDELVTQAGRSAAERTRLGLYQQAERVLVEDAAAAFLTHQKTFQVWWPYLTGFPPDKSGNVVFRYLDIARFQMYLRNDVDQWRG